MSENPVVGHEVIIAFSAQDRQNCLDIRFEVFHKEQGFPSDSEIDEYDEGDKATHFLLRLKPDLTPIGTVRCVKLTPSTYKLSRLAVLKNYRKNNFGRVLVLALHDWIKARLELIDKSSENSASYSEQTYTSATVKSTISSCGPIYPMCTNNDHHHPDQDRSKPSNIRNAPGSVSIITHSQIPVEGFYARLGYQPEGEQFYEDGEPHQRMVLQIPLVQVVHAQ